MVRKKMRLFENASQALIGPEEDKLVLNLSEPHFTLFQLVRRRFRQFISHCKDWVHFYVKVT